MTPTPSRSCLRRRACVAPVVAVAVLVASVFLVAPTGKSRCRLTNLRALTDGISLGHPRSPMRLKATGTVRIGVVFVDFADAVATRTTQSVLDLISPAAERRFAAVSYGRVTFELVPVHGWVRMSRVSSAYGMSRGRARSRRIVPMSQRPSTSAFGRST